MAPKVASCLNRRYEALDNLIRDLCCESRGFGDPGVQLMCSIWDALKHRPERCQEDPQEVNKPSHFSMNPYVYMAQNDQEHTQKPGGAIPKSSNYSEGENTSGPSRVAFGKENNDMPPLSKALNNLQKAASADRDCKDKLVSLIEYQKCLQKSIEKLEKREKEGVKLLQEADALWNGMENTYKEKIAASLEKQISMVSTLQDVEKSVVKWKRNKKELESQLESIANYQQEINAKVNQRTNDIKLVEKEIASLNGKIKKSHQENDSLKSGLVNKKKKSDATLAKLTTEIQEIEKEMRQEKLKKKEKEDEAKGYIKVARADLQEISKLLIQKQLEVEDRIARKKAVIEECNIIKASCDSCQERCQNKEAHIVKEIKLVDQEIADWKLKCEKCNVATDSGDNRKFCSDCPRCVSDRVCEVKGMECFQDSKQDCVCLEVKRQFLENVFENMYILMLKKSDLPEGKAIAQEIFECLERSRNGKLNEPTRKSLQEFIIGVMKNNLNLTIVGGATKTRCEMDKDTYNQLQLCLKTVKVTRIPKVDEGTDPKKPPCDRWTTSAECNCPKGPKQCICTKKVPPPIDDPELFPSAPPGKTSEKVSCPIHKNVPRRIDGGYLLERNTTGIVNKKPELCVEGTGYKGKAVATSTLYKELITKEPNTKVVTNGSEYKRQGSGGKATDKEKGNDGRGIRTTNKGKVSSNLKTSISCACGKPPGTRTAKARAAQCDAFNEMDRKYARRKQKEKAETIETNIFIATENQYDRRNAQNNTIIRRSSRLMKLNDKKEIPNAAADSLQESLLGHKHFKTTTVRDRQKLQKYSTVLFKKHPTDISSSSRNYIIKVPLIDDHSNLNYDNNTKEITINSVNTKQALVERTWVEQDKIGLPSQIKRSSTERDRYSDKPTTYKNLVHIDNHENKNLVCLYTQEMQEKIGYDTNESKLVIMKSESECDVKETELATKSYDSFRLNSIPEENSQPSSATVPELKFVNGDANRNILSNIYSYKKFDLRFFFLPPPPSKIQILKGSYSSAFQDESNIYFCLNLLKHHIMHNTCIAGCRKTDYNSGDVSYPDEKFNIPPCGTKYITFDRNNAKDSKSNKVTRMTRKTSDENKIDGKLLGELNGDMDL